MEVKTSKAFNVTKGLLYSILVLILVGGMINCGGGKPASNPVTIQAPKTLIQDYIAKYATMVDTSLVNFYVMDEQATVAAAVQKAIEEKTASGELEKLQSASFDFSNLQISVVGEKEAYIHDEPTKVIKVAVSGSYVMKLADNTSTIPADKTIILEMIDKNWKVTERVNPWKEYNYKSRG
jgi:hypothetical protein